MNISDLNLIIDERRDELFSLLSDLIKVNSENFRSHGNEREIAEFIGGICNGLGLEGELYSPMDIEGFASHPDYFPGRNLEQRFNYTARWPGKENRDGLMLMAHHDTVEIGNPESWSGDPLSGKIENGRIYGRGACDDKYAIAASLFLIKILKEAGFRPSKNVLFTAFCDEEHGGSHGALAAVLRYPADITLSLDGRQREIWHCASGGGGLKYVFKTKDPVNTACVIASALPTVLKELDEFGKRRRAEFLANAYYSGTNIPNICHRYMCIKAGNNGIDLGTGEVHFTYYTDSSREQIESELSAINARLGELLAPMGMISCGFEPKTRFFHYAHCAPDDACIKTLVSCAKEATGRDLLVCGSCLSDLSVIAKYSPGIAFAFGMGREFGQEGGAHQPNEFIEIDDLIEYTKNLGAYVLRTMS